MAPFINHVLILLILKKNSEEAGLVTQRMISCHYGFAESLKPIMFTFLMFSLIFSYKAQKGAPSLSERMCVLMPVPQSLSFPPSPKSFSSPAVLQLRKEVSST